MLDLKLPLKVIIAAFLSTATQVEASQISDNISPEVKIALDKKANNKPASSKNWMVVAANPLAVEAGAKVLKLDGTAADAMVAVQTVLGLVEPQSSGLGGGAFLVWYDGKTGEILTLDGRETAPLAATPKLFQNESGDPLKFYDAVVGGLSVGTPGTPALMQAAHHKWGKLKWPSLFDDAIIHAENGFSVSPRLAGMLENDAKRLSQFADTAALLIPHGEPLKAGDLLQNPGYAQTLRKLAKDGSAVFYNGDIAKDIVNTVQGANGNPGFLSLTDLRNYRIKERPAACVKYRVFDVCGMGPPSSGALSVGQILGMLNYYDLPRMGQDQPNAWRLIGDASRLAFADRGRYIADSDFVPVPVVGLLDPAYLRRRSELLSGNKALEDVSAGEPGFDHAIFYSDDDSLEFPSTSHFSIVDTYGNALSMTTTIENAFGSRLMTKGGFLLNNELTDFSFRSHRDGVPIANRVEPGKRPRSSMAPTIVLQDGAPVLVVGSPGGSRIIGYVVKTIIAHLDWQLDIQEAVNLPNLVNRFGTFDVEQGTTAENLAKPLSKMGFKVRARNLNSGLHAISLKNGQLSGGADYRREGVAVGDDGLMP